MTIKVKSEEIDPREFEAAAYEIDIAGMNLVRTVESYKEDWRERLVQKTTRLTDAQKAKYIEMLERTGRLGMAATAACTTTQTALSARSEDPEFEAACLNAASRRADRVVEQLEREALEGHIEYIYDKEGNLISERKVFESAMRLAMLKRHDPEYREAAATTNISVNSGVLVIPATQSVEEWEAAAKANREATIASLGADGAGVPSVLPSS